MRKLLIIGCLVTVQLQAQQYSKDITHKIQQVENSLSPGIIYDDTLPKFNLETRLKETGVKGLSIAVINNYKIEWAKGYGWADEASGRKVTPQTRFQAASISKSLNSLAILQLVQQKKLDPKADINVYLKRWKFPYDRLSKGKKINVYQLLSHTAGLNVHGFPGYGITDTLPTLVQILNGTPPSNTGVVRSVFEPGLKFQYSGGGTTISQLLLEDITAQSYADYMQKHVLGPLGMQNSSFHQPPPAGVDLATGYYSETGDAVKGNYHVYPEQAAAGLWTTPTDLAKYIIECQLAFQKKSAKVISPELMRTRMTPYLDSSFALGVFLTKRGPYQYFFHNGGNEAFLCTSYGNLQAGKGVVIMINGDNFEVINELMNSVATVYNWTGFFTPEFKKTITIPVEQLEQYVGAFQLNKDTLTLKVEKNKLVIRQNGQPAEGYEVFFTNPNNFLIKEIHGAAFRFERNESDAVTGLEIEQGGGKVTAVKIKQ